MKGLLLWATVAVAVIVMALGGWMLWGGSAGRADADNPRQVAEGARLYEAHCARCHGAKLEGQPDWKTRLPNGRLPAPPHDASGHTWHHPDDHLFRLTKFGMQPPLAPEGYESDMPPFKEVISDSEIWSVLAYIKSSWPPLIRARQQRLTDNLRQ